MAEVLPVTFLISSTFSVILPAVKGKKYFRDICILVCRPTQTRKHLYDVPSWHLIFLLHAAALHENITLQLRSFSLEDGTSQHLHIRSYKLPGLFVYFEMKARHVDASTWK